MGGHGAEVRLLVHEVQRLAFQIVQTVQILPVGADGVPGGGRIEADHGLENVPLTLLDHLTQRVEVGGELGGHGEQTLAVLALGLAEQLLPPAAEHLEARLVALKDLHGLAVAIQQVPHGGILPDGVLEGTQIVAFLGVGSTVHHLHDVDTGHSQGQQTHGGQHGVAAAHIRRDDEGFPALFRGHLAQSALAGVGDGVDAALGALGAVLPLQHPAQSAGGNGGFGGGAGLGDDGDGEVLALQQPGQLVPVTGAQAVACEEDLGVALALTDIAVGTLQQLDGGTGAEVGAADADDHKYVGIAADLLRRPLDAGDLFRGLPDGQVLPAEEIVACAGAVRQSGVGGGDFLFHGQQVGQGDLTPYIGDINFNHVVGHVLSFIYVILSYVTANSPETQAPSQKVSMGTVPNFFIFSTGNFARIMYNGEELHYHAGGTDYEIRIWHRSRRHHRQDRLF